MKTYKVGLYPNAQGKEREIKIEADKIRDHNGNVHFLIGDTDELICVVSRASFELVREVQNG